MQVFIADPTKPHTLSQTKTANTGIDLKPAYRSCIQAYLRTVITQDNDGDGTLLVEQSHEKI